MTVDAKKIQGNIAILYGGESREREISLKTGRAFFDALVSAGYEPTLVDATREGLRDICLHRPDVALLALHGGAGEDGTVQGLLEALGIPYTGSGVYASAVSMHKDTAKILFRHAGIPTPDWDVLSRQDLEDTLAAPRLAWHRCVLKPVSAGSSVGVTLALDAASYRAGLEALLACEGPGMRETLVEGREVTVGMMGQQVMGVIEVVPGNPFYDFEAKYGDADTRYIYPAPVTQKVNLRVADVARAVVRTLGVRGVSRVDLMLDSEGAPWVLEVNTVPGMTATSLVPKIAKATGVPFPSFVEMMLREATLDSDLAFGT